MAESTSAGSVFLDLVVRDTTGAQIRKIADNAQSTVQKSFAGVEKVTQHAADSIGACTGKGMQKAADSVARCFDKTVALAEAKTRQLNEKLEDITAKLRETQHKDFSFQIYGYVSDGNKEYTRLLKEQEKLLAQVDAAEERLAIEREAAAQRAALKQAQEAERAAQRAMAAEQKAAAKREAAAQKTAAVEAQAAQKAAEAEEKAASRRKAIHAKMWKNMLSKAGAGAKSLLAKLGSIGKGYDGVGKTARRFGSRLREIASGALIFNGISSALRGMVNYFSKAIAEQSQMQKALANLKGAAANAASPIIQVLTPALAALANMAATVFTYVAKLLTMLTGKISTAASSASKSAGAAKKAMASLAGFDEIQRLDGKDDSGADDGIEPNYQFEGKSPFLDDILAAVEAGQWEQVGSLIAQKLNESLLRIQWPDIYERASAWTQNLVSAINGFTGKLGWELLGSSIGVGLNTILAVIDTFFQGTDWVGLGEGFRIGLSGLFQTVDWAGLGQVLTDHFKAITEIFHGFVTDFDFGLAGRSFAEMFLAGVNNIDWKQLLNDICAGIMGLCQMVTEFVLAIDWQQLGNQVADCFASVDWGGVFVSITTGIGAALGGLASFLWGLIEDAWDSMMNTWLENIDRCGGDVVAGLLLGILEGLADIGTWIADHIFKPFIDGFTSAFGIHSPSTIMEEQGGFIIAGLLNGITTAWESVKAFFGTALDDMETKLSEAFEGIRAVAADIWENGIVPAIKNPINAIIGFINGLISGVVSGVNTVIRALNRLSITVPDWLKYIPGMSGIAGQHFGFNISQLSAPQIPMLAGGGVIKQPTLAMMGEYAGARSNPEIVAPQSILEETVSQVMRELIDSNLQGFEMVVAVLKDILEAVLGIDIDGETLSNAVEEYRRKRAVSVGG